MRFVKGLLLGSLVGFAAGSALSDRQREKIAAAARHKAAPVSTAITDNLHRVADTVVDEATTKIDTAGEAVADKIATESPAP